MAELASVGNVGRSSVEFGTVRLVGRLTGSRRFEKLYYSFLTLPAVDAFSHPQVVEIRSDVRLGEVGEDVEIQVRIGGYNKKPYRFTDKETGETRMVTQNVVTLTVL